jgi:hypothetical protein
LSEWFSSHPEAAKDETDCHAARLAANYASMARACDFAAYDTIVDVGGGHGELLVQILEHNPRVHGVLAELPFMLERATERLRAAGLLERCERVATDFFTGVPRDGDLYVLHQILHDWNDEDCAAILRACRRSMHASSRLIVIEMVIVEHDGLSMARLLDLEMLVMGCGKERTEAELRRLFEACDLELTRVAPARGEMVVFELAAA